MSSEESRVSVKEEEGTAEANTLANEKWKRQPDGNKESGYIWVVIPSVPSFDGAAATNDNAATEEKGGESKWHRVCHEDTQIFAHPQPPKPPPKTRAEISKAYRERQKIIKPKPAKPPPKTKAERSKAYRERQKLLRGPKPPAKSAAERQKEYRERQKLRQSGEFEEVTTPMVFESPCVDLCNVRLPGASQESNAERCKIYRERQKNTIPYKQAKTTAERVRECRERKKLIELSRKYGVELPPILNMKKKSDNSSNPTAPIEAPKIKTEDTTLGIGLDIKEEPIDFNMDARNENNCDVEQRYNVSSTSISNTGFTFVNVGPSDFPVYDPVDNDAGKRTSEKSTQTEEKTHDKCVQANPDMCDKTFQTLKLEDKCV